MSTESKLQTPGDLPAGLSQPALRALAGAGISKLSHLAKLTEAEVKGLHGIGPNALSKLKRALSSKGFSFADKKKKKAEIATHG